MNLDALQQTLLDGRTKGIPATAAPFPLADIGKKGWNVLARRPADAADAAQAQRARPQRLRSSAAISPATACRWRRTARPR